MTAGQDGCCHFTEWKSEARSQTGGWGAGPPPAWPAANAHRPELLWRPSSGNSCKAPSGKGGDTGRGSWALSTWCAPGAWRARLHFLLRQRCAVRAPIPPDSRGRRGWGACLRRQVSPRASAPASAPRLRAQPPREPRPPAGDAAGSHSERHPAGPVCPHRRAGGSRQVATGPPEQGALRPGEWGHRGHQGHQVMPFQPPGTLNSITNRSLGKRP